MMLLAPNIFSRYFFVLLLIVLQGNRSAYCWCCVVRFGISFTN